MARNPDALPRIRAEVEAVDLVLLERWGYITIGRDKLAEIHVRPSMLPPGLWWLRRYTDQTEDGECWQLFHREKFLEVLDGLCEPSPN